MSAGRPSDYSQAMLDRTTSYLQECETQGVMPQIAQLAYQLEVSRSTLYLWAKEHSEFSDKLEKLLSLQEFTLIGNGLNGKFNSTITKLILTKHGYKEATETDLTSGGDKLTVQPIMYATTNSAQVQPEAIPAQSPESTG